MIDSFSAYIASLATWKRDLLQGAFRSNDTQSLAQHLVRGTPILLCSKGGATRNAGSYGWVIVTATHFLWEFCGTATGWFANSFRSRAIGQLPLPVFLEAFLAYYQLLDINPPPWLNNEPWIRIPTENQGLILRIKAGLATTTAFASAGLISPEYDVVNEILEITPRLPIPLKWEHVKGHQDDVRKW